MTPERPARAADDRALRGAAAWAVLAMAAVFLLIAALFVAAPALDRASLTYVRALGLRDLALGLYLLGLVLFSSRRAVGVVLAATVVIPAGDMLLALWSGGAVLSGAPHAAQAERHLLCRCCRALVAAAGAGRGG